MLGTVVGEVNSGTRSTSKVHGAVTESAQAQGRRVTNTGPNVDAAESFSLRTRGQRLAWTQLQLVGAPLTLVQVLLVAQGLSEMVVPLTAMF